MILFSPLPSLSMFQNILLVFGSTLSGCFPKPSKSFVIPGIVSIMFIFSRCFFALMCRFTFRANSPFFVLTRDTFLFMVRAVEVYAFVIMPTIIRKRRMMNGKV